MPLALCLCAEIPRIETATRFLIIRHSKESWRTSNTARIAALALPAARVLDHGGLEDGRIDRSELAEGGSWLLFPGSRTDLSSLPRPRQLVVLDGSWRQARRILQRMPGVSELPRLSLPSAVEDRPRLRRPPIAEGMSTLEAIAGAVSMLEGSENAEALFRLNEVFVERARRVKGRRSEGGHLSQAGGAQHGEAARRR